MTIKKQAKNAVNKPKKKELKGEKGILNKIKKATKYEKSIANNS